MTRRRHPRWIPVHRAPAGAPTAPRPPRTASRQEIARRLDQRRPLDHRPPIV